MDKGQKIRAGLGVRLVVVTIALLSFYTFVSYINGDHGKKAPDDIRSLADKKVDRFYVDGNDTRPLYGMDVPSGFETPVAGSVNE